MKNSNSWRHGVTGLAFLVLVGCGTKQENGPAANPYTAPPRQESAPRADGTPRTEPASRAATRLRAQVRTLPQPNAYQVALDWRHPANDAELWVVQRDDTRQGPRTLATLGKEAWEFLDTSVAAGETYRYHLSTLRGAEPQILASVTVTIPRDFVVQGAQAYRSIKDVNRLFFAKGAKLVTRDSTLEIAVDQIISDDGVIESFGADERGIVGRDGLAGGRITIRAKSGSGVLFIEARGQSAGAGSTGNPGALGESGAPGRPGRMEVVPGPLQFPPNWQNRMFLREPIVLEPGPPVKRCAQLPTDGEPGRGGGPGGKGLTGGRGGNTPRFHVEIQNASAIQVKPTTVPGQGGPGGAGGPGGLPGKGGAAGPQDPEKLCAAARNGADGAPGARGPEGDAGPAGNVEPFCLKLGTASYGSCDRFPPDPTIVE